MSSFNIINPYTLKNIDTLPFHSIEDTQKKIKMLHQSYIDWKNTTFHFRASIIQQFGIFLANKKETIAETISKTMGKPICEALKEVNKCIECCTYYSKNNQKIEQLCRNNSVIKEPLGVILGIMPWNFPLWQIIRYIIPALITGNTCLIKPALNTYPVCQCIMTFFKGLSAEVVDIIALSNEDTEALIKHPLINGVSLTGSVKAGRIVGALASKYIKPCVLELGGSDPYIVFNDANIKDAAKAAVNARFTNAGQTCISAKRFIIHQSIYTTFLNLFKTHTENYLTYGNPLELTTTIGPIARKDLLNQLNHQYKTAKLPKNSILFKQETKNKTGYFFPAQIIDGSQLPPTNPLLTQEIFGPIAICLPFNTPQEAISIANHTEFGLGASIWSINDDIINDCIKAINCGTIAINTTVKSQVDIPFGGRKNSGLGIELGLEGALSFTGVKSILRE